MNRYITEDETQTADELYRQQWFSQLAPDHQQLALAHQIDQYEAVPSYIESQAAAFAAEQEGGATWRG